MILIPVIGRRRKFVRHPLAYFRHGCPRPYCGPIGPPSAMVWLNPCQLQLRLQIQALRRAMTIAATMKTVRPPSTAQNPGTPVWV